MSTKSKIPNEYLTGEWTVTDDGIAIKEIHTKTSTVFVKCKCRDLGDGYMELELIEYREVYNGQSV